MFNPLSVEEFGAVGDGSNERVKFEEAFAVSETTGRPLYLGRNKTYHLGNIAAEDCLFVIKGGLIYGHNVRLTVTSQPAPCYVFAADSFDDLAFAGITIECTNPDYANVVGPHAFLLRSLTDGSHGARFINCRAKGCLSGVTVQTGGTNLPRVRGIHFENFVAEDCYYGAQFQDEGDAVTGKITAINCRRPYFAYGVRDHSLDVDVEVRPGGNPYGSSMAVLVTKSGKYDTGPMETHVTFRGDLSRYGALTGSGIVMHDATTGGKCGPWKLHCDIDPAATGISNKVRFRLDSYQEPPASGPHVLASGKPNQWCGLYLSGNFLNGGVPVHAMTPTLEQTVIDLGPGVRIKDWKTIEAGPKIAFRLAPDREVRIIKGSLDGQVFRIPVTQQGNGYALKHRLTAFGTGGMAFGNSVIREDVVAGSVSQPDGGVNCPVQAAVLAPVGPGNKPTITFSGEVGNATVTLAGADYTASGSFAMLETTFIGEQG